VRRPSGRRLAEGWLAGRLPRRTIRLRLTLLYGGLFVLCGAALLGITYVLVARRYSNSFFIATGKRIATERVASARQPQIAFPGIVIEWARPLSPGNVIAQAHAQSLAALHALLIQSGIALAIMALASLWLGWLVAGRALRPLRTITNAAREISASDLHRRLALPGPDDELTELGRTFDGLLERLEAAFAAQRAFVANASHELRTPLTLERALVEVALADPDATVESLRATCAHVLRAGEEQERLIEALLTLSRSQRGLDRREQVDLGGIAADVVDSVDAGDPAFEAAFQPALTNGDPHLLERLIANLVGNAVRHNVDRGWVAVSTATQPGYAVLSVSNSGPRVPADELERLFQPFQRLDGDRRNGRDGLGLGLSIVDAIARAHGAVVDARAREQGGLSVEVLFPISVLRPAPR
jgi:signal transduction histidine kinase